MLQLFSGKENEHKPNLLGPDIFHVNERGPKRTLYPLEPSETKLLGGISRDFAGISRERHFVLSFWPQLFRAHAKGVVLLKRRVSAFEMPSRKSLLRTPSKNPSRSPSYL